jgi:hypothetical protein
VIFSGFEPVVNVDESFRVPEKVSENVLSNYWGVSMAWRNSIGFSVVHPVFDVSGQFEYCEILQGLPPNFKYLMLCF